MPVENSNSDRHEDFVALYVRHEPAVFSFVLGMVGRTVDAEDVGPFQTKFGEDTFVVIEKWENLERLMAHAASEHMKAYATATKSLIANRIIHVLSST